MWLFRLSNASSHEISSSCTWCRHQMERYSALLPFLRGIHRWPANSPIKSRDAEIWCFLWTAHNHTHYDVTVMAETPSVGLTYTTLSYIIPCKSERWFPLWLDTLLTTRHQMFMSHQHKSHISVTDDKNAAWNVIACFTIWKRIFFAKPKWFNQINIKQFVCICKFVS